MLGGGSCLPSGPSCTTCPLGHANCGQQSSDGPEASRDVLEAAPLTCPIRDSCTCCHQLVGSRRQPLSQATGGVGFSNILSQKCPSTQKSPRLAQGMALATALSVLLCLGQVSWERPKIERN